MSNYYVVLIALLVNSVTYCSLTTHLYAQYITVGTDEEGNFHTVFYDPTAQKNGLEDVIIVKTRRQPQVPIPGGRHVVPTAFASHARTAQEISLCYSSQVFRGILKARRNRQPVDMNNFWRELNIMRGSYPKPPEERSALSPSQDTHYSKTSE